MANYKIKGVTIEVRPGVVLTAEISGVGELKELMDDLSGVGFGSATSADKAHHKSSEPGKPGTDDSPMSRIETRAALPSGKLATSKMLAFKDENPQLLRPASFASVSDATLFLLYAVEIGLQRPSVPFDDFKDLYDAQNIKSGSALPMLLTNLRNSGYIDKKAYAADRTVRLTAKGAAKAEEVIKGICGT